MIQNFVYQGDCLHIMENWRFQPTLIVADPPYNIGVQYGEYKDKLKPHDYIEWCGKWIKRCYDILTDDGSLWIVINSKYVRDVLNQAEIVDFHLKNWIIWQYNFGQAQQNKFTPCHTHLLHLVKNPDNFIFNADLIRFPSQRLIKYKDKRANPAGSLPGDVWNYSRVCGSFKEKRNTPNQLPGALLRRIIFACSDEGDLILDPFVGSGTTCIEAKRLKRNYIGIDISQKYVDICNQNLDDMHNEEELCHIILNDLLRECNITLDEFKKLDKHSQLYKCLIINFDKRSGVVYNL